MAHTNGAQHDFSPHGQPHTADDHPQLSATHLTMLREESGIADAVITERGYRTLDGAEGHAELKRLAFSPRQAKLLPGLVLPLWTTDGQNGLTLYKPDTPRRNQKDEPIKYETPQGAGLRVDCPPRCRPLLADPAIPLWITEGQKKADALASRGACVIDLLGVWAWKGKNPFGGITVLADFDYITWPGREVRLVFDSDVMVKPSVRQALDRLTEMLRRKHAVVRTVYLPHANGHKVGVDDYLVAGHTLADLEGLIEAPRPQPQLALAKVTLLDEAPVYLRRPLALINGRAYAATWLWARIERPETLNKAGEIVRHTPPLVSTEQRLFIVRNDGTVFGEGEDQPLEALPLSVHLPEIPPPDTLWSLHGVQAYRQGQRPDPVHTFTKVVDVIDRVMDFKRSLDEQRTMAEMLGCYVLATWFLDAFNVIGFLWPNGDRGSGKTHLITIIARLGYLGQVLTAGGTFAALRDLADYGATLAFDDAENLASEKRVDPDKRALFLAGNRRGNTIPVKELTPEKHWVTRHVSTFCPRLFSATRLPDPIMASRTIVVPLIRTPDPYRANVDPEDYDAWPHERRLLIDELWALALAHLPNMARYNKEVATHASITGRALEPWRALLAIARWLDACGATDLFARLDTLSLAYQREQLDMDSSDLMVLTIRALCHWAIRAIRAINLEQPAIAEWKITAAEIKRAMIDMSSEEDLDPELITIRRVGRTLGKMRLKKAPRHGGKGSRQWSVTLEDLQSWTTAYGVQLPDQLAAFLPTHPHGSNGPNGPNGPNGSLTRAAHGAEVEEGVV